MDYELNRREFLEVSAAASLAGLVEIRIGHELTAEERRTLLAVVRTLFPRGGDDQGYFRAARAIEWRCTSDATAYKVVTDGLGSLDRAFGGGFEGAGERSRIRLLKAAEDTPFFRLVYAETLESLYGSPEAWARLASARHKS